MISRFSELSLLSFNQILQKLREVYNPKYFGSYKGLCNSVEHKLTVFPHFLPLERINRAVEKLLIKAVHWDANLTVHLPSAISSTKIPNCVPDWERLVHINSPRQLL